MNLEENKITIKCQTNLYSSYFKHRNISKSISTIFPSLEKFPNPFGIISKCLEKMLNLFKNVSKHLEK